MDYDSEIWKINGREFPVVIKGSYSLGWIYSVDWLSELIKEKSNIMLMGNDSNNFIKRFNGICFEESVRNLLEKL